MPSVLCSSKLHRALRRGAYQEADRRRRQRPLGRLGGDTCWQRFVVAIEDETCLTLVVRLLPVPGFRAGLLRLFDRRSEAVACLQRSSQPNAGRSAGAIRERA